MTDRPHKETAVPTELENDLADLLHARAAGATVDPEAAFAEHGRRLRAANTRRTVTLAAAAVAVVSAGTLLAVPHATPTESVAAPPLRVSNAPAPAATVPTFRIAEFTANGTTWVAWAVLKDNCLDIVGLRAGQPVDVNSPRQYPGASDDCPLTVQDPKQPMVMMTGVLDGASDEVNTSPLPELSVWVTQSEVARLDITLADKQTVPTRLLGTAGNLKLFLCEHTVKYYRADTYYDASGRQLYRDTTPFDK